MKIDGLLNIAMARFSTFILYMFERLNIFSLDRALSDGHIIWTSRVEFGTIHIWIHSPREVMDLGIYIDHADQPYRTLGLTHTAIITIDGSLLENTRMIELRGTVKDAKAFACRCGPVTTIVANHFHRIFSRNAGALQIVREIEVRPAVILEKTDELPNPLGEKVATSTMGHFRHIVELAASEEASLPPIEPDIEPLISLIIPVYDTPVEYLEDILTSYRLQPRGLCELVFSDDASPSERTRSWLVRHETSEGIQVVFNSTNQGIAGATNAGLAVARGEWVGFLDHDDALTPFAIARIVRALRSSPNCKFLYTDEIVADGDLRPTDYFLKPAWDPILLSGVNYINHLSVYKRLRLLDVGGVELGYDGSQDYDLLLRYTAGLTESEVKHLPYPAYLWRRSGQTYSAKFLEKATLNARRSLKKRYGGGELQVDPALVPDLHRVRFDLRKKRWPSISVIIPNKDSPELLETVLTGLDQTDYPLIEILVIDNGSTDRRTIEMYRQRTKENVKFRAIVESAPFNFAYSINKGINLAEGELILILNNDIEILEPNWLKEMVACLDYENVGIVGAKLLYPSRKIQHVGVIAGLGDLAGHWFIGKDENYPGPMGRLWVRQSLSCVTGACMLISRECIATVGGFDESNFAIAYNDIDYGLRSIKAGFKVAWTPFTCLIHHESASRGSDVTPKNIDRFRREQDNLKRIHGTDHFEDPAFNPWLSRRRSEPVPILLKSLPMAR